MSDSEVRRLEDRIDAVNREGQLRLDAAMARIDGKIDTIAVTLVSMQNELRSTRVDQKMHFQWLVGIVLAVGLALGAAVVALSQSDRAALANVIAAFSAGLAAKADSAPKP